ncbi:hypothetical protein JQ557_30260 [Bradyrhizobium sp. U87765 SZCCT0131]|uniref:hypothetical protein n=1 Tax=unclassified Bradyrhizobium TaxID=2631580 RepID=UPI001BA4CF86|nr:MULTISPECIES: hypothetical protein [unclassified Bradyrhizobium]MBR1222318.1 hypothetical protein [Bradyrhizobium sp. U87765 SZCCT0131]MBR1264198.1 hypothetical protein [Bradyrhizobium sp. U87765 SZCCT0134]MBR1308019.1 hypothetical protein [Bradyrhizobium sp. U87765 SZCCT0110]MBR1320448.1 hypothetical protein [Bradyrhizobium sp. U87765 SZCCT0109]MBR1348439.1 hypothetical protein [Bradyrhizobium sp. U87765 SZCCT0048]
MKTLATFLLFAIGGAALAALASFASYDALTAHTRKVPFSYPQLLLERVEGPRIVIDAGSSTMFGVEPALIEAAFRTPVIDVADNGSIPLDMKIYRMLRYARAGDILIVPLEWVYYTRDIVPLDFIDKTPNEYAAYYASQPGLQRLMFAVQHVSLHNLSDAARLYMRENLLRSNYRQIRDEHAKWPYGDRKDDHRRRSSVDNISCADYIAAAGTMPPVVEWAAEKLAELQASRGVRVYLTWPAVAGTDCYKLTDGKLPIAEEARAIFGRHGIAVVGDVADSLFAPAHMLDTYYHVDSSAARVRTERLIGRLRDGGLKAAAETLPSTPTLADKALRSLEATMDPRDAVFP